MTTRLLTALGVLPALSMMAAPALSAGIDDAKTVACVTLRQIDHTHVIDDQNILFYTRGDRIYLNRLMRSAPGLDKDQPFMYRTMTSQLCENDVITVLERWGFGLTQGASSRLGKFQPIDEARAKALRSENTSEDGVETLEVE